MITIIEGPDHSGKSTLAQSTFADHEYVHVGPPPKEWINGVQPAFKQYLGLLQKAVMSGEDVVFDRMMYGERIYGPLYRSDHSYTPALHRMLERVVLGYRGLLVKALPPWEVVYQGWASRRDQEMVQDGGKFRLIYEGWEALFNGSGYGFYRLPDVPVAHWDYDQNRGAQLTSPVIRNVFEKCRAPENFGPGIGMFKSDETITLIVGERVNPKIDTMGWPFVAGRGSSLWLAEQLETAQVPESRLYWVNAKDRDGQFIDATFVRRLKPKGIIALGAVAKQWCLKHGFPHAAVPHPAYWCRFHARERYPLLSVINERITTTYEAD